MSTALLLVALLILGLVSDWRHRRQLAPLLRALAEIRQDLIDGTVAIVQDVSGSEARLSAALGAMHDELNASLLRLQDDAVTRISEIQAQPAQVVRVEVPSALPAATVSAVVPVTQTRATNVRREVTLILMDADEALEVHRATIDPLRRSRRVTHDGVWYSHVRGPAETGEFIYRRDR